jgi:flagellar assembly protein FliH
MSSSTDLAGFTPARLGLAAEADDVRREARAAGYAAGWAEGRRAAAVAAAAELDRLQADVAMSANRSRVSAEAAVVAALESWNRRTAPVLDDVADLVVDTALDLAEAIIGRELSAVTSRDLGRMALRRALAPLAPGSPVTLRMCPSDLAAIGGPTDTAEGHAVRIVPDERLSPGEAIAEQDGATVDARIQAALDRARTVAKG